jgi:hypothetical protein
MILKIMWEPFNSQNGGGWALVPNKLEICIDEFGFFVG